MIILLKTSKTHLCMNCLSIVSLCYRNSLQQVFEMSSLRANTRMQTLSPLADSSVNNTLLQTARSKRQPVAAWVRRHCESASRTHAAAWSPKSCNQQGSGPDCWGPYLWRNEISCFMLHELDCITCPMCRYAVLLKDEIVTRNMSDSG